MRAVPALSMASLLLLAGCHSAFVNATLQNETGGPITLVELDYPSASFGTQTLAPGQKFTYRFKVLGSGNLKLLWTDAQHTDRHADGPALGEGAEGALLVRVLPQDVQWSAPRDTGRH